jgi:hypothetical protein
MGFRAHAQSLEIFELYTLGFWRNSYFQIKEKNKRKGKGKRDDLTHDLYLGLLVPTIMS